MALNYGICLGEESREYTSAEFCEAVQAVFGDGICKFGSGFSVTPGGFDLNVSTGYAVAIGKFLKSNGKSGRTISPSSNTKDRYDALAVRVDYQERRVELAVLKDVEPDAIKSDPVIVRNSREYCLILYFIHVRRGATTLSPYDIEDVRDNSDLCGRVIPLAEASGHVLYIYKYLTEGIDEKAAWLMSESERILQKGDDAISRIDSILIEKGIYPVVGELQVALNHPLPAAEWLLCDGGAVPAAYPKLTAVIGTALPNISLPSDKVKTYIYAGKSEQIRR